MQVLFNPEQIFQVLLIFSRIAATFVFLPGIGERYFPRYTRAVITFASAIIMQPVLSSNLPTLPSSYLALIIYLFGEVLVGIALGLSSRLYFWILDILGNLLAMQSGLSAASFFDPNQRSQIPIFSTLLSLIGFASIWVSDVHHLFFYGIASSYYKFKVGELYINDLAHLLSVVMSDSFFLAFQISAPFLVVNIATQLGAGVLSRLIPSLQIFFIITPLQVLTTLGVLLITLNLIILKVIEYSKNSVALFT